MRTLHAWFERHLWLCGAVVFLTVGSLAAIFWPRAPQPVRQYEVDGVEILGTWISSSHGDRQILMFASDGWAFGSQATWDKGRKVQWQLSGNALSIEDAYDEEGGRAMSHITVSIQENGKYLVLSEGSPYSGKYERF